MHGVLAALAVLSVVALTGCGGDDAAGEPASTLPTTIAMHSSAFTDGGPIPVRYTCDGAGEMPPLSWSSESGDARALALVVDDPDAPSGTFTHWVVLDLPPDTRSVGAGRLPSGAVEGTNSAGSTGWTPPCPPKGDHPHHYRFTVYSLDSRTGLRGGATLSDSTAAIDAHAIARGRLTGTYARR